MAKLKDYLADPLLSTMYAMIRRAGPTKSRKISNQAPGAGQRIGHLFQVLETESQSFWYI